MMDDFRAPKPKRLRPTPKQLPKTKEPGEPAFRPPEEVAAEDEVKEAKAAAFAGSARLAARHVQARVNHHWNNSRKTFIAITVVALVLIAGITYWVVQQHRRPAVAGIPKTSPIVKAKPVTPTTVPSALTGLPVDPSANNRPVTGIMIENSMDARPQSGLSQAGVVFEAVAEGGVTRFLALFQDQSPDNVGPIRSARPYFVQWDMGFDAPLAHVGGSPDALNDIKSWGTKNLDQFANGGAYHRVSNRPGPHNVYSGLPTLNQLESSKGYTKSTFTGFPRKKAAPAKQPTATTINMSLSSSIYNPSYAYDAPTNTYKRSEGGSAQTDAGSGAQVAPTVVIAIVVPLSQGALDASGAYYSNYSPIGSGQAYIFQDGTVTAGQWSKLSNEGQITFTDSSNQPIALDPGQTWISAVTSASKVSYQ